MCYVEDNEISHKMIQDGNCIGFIKNGDGSAGYAIYKQESLNEDHITGSIPYVSSSSLNNGIDDFVGNELKVRKYKNCLSLANSGSVGSCFYEPFEFIASDHVTHLQNDNFSMYTYLFIATMARRLSEKYNFNREISDTRIRREKILLPITDDGAPDYEYMDQFMKNLMVAKYKQYFECYK